MMMSAMMQIESNGLGKHVWTEISPLSHTVSLSKHIADNRQCFNVHIPVQLKYQELLALEDIIEFVVQPVPTQQCVYTKISQSRLLMTDVSASDKLFIF
jgi:hypothetical protein